MPASTSDVIFNASSAPYSVSANGATIGTLLIDGRSGAASAPAALAISGGTFTIEGTAANGGILAIGANGILKLLNLLTNTGIVAAYKAGATINLDLGSILGGEIYIANGPPWRRPRVGLAGGDRVQQTQLSIPLLSSSELWRPLTVHP